MKKIKNIKIWAGIFVATMMLTSLVVVTATVKADPPKPVHFPPPIPKPVPPPLMPSCSVLWAQTWSNGEPSIAESGRITTDTWNNIYTVGRDNFGQATVLKYYPNGDLAWENHPTSYDAVEDLAVLGGYDLGKGQQAAQYRDIQAVFLQQVNSYMLWDVAFSPKDNTVVSCGWATIDGINVVFVAKNDISTGTQLWGRQYSFLQAEFGQPMAAAITVDTNGDIFISGTVIQLNDQHYILAVSGLYIKIGEYGLTRDTQIDETPSGWLTVYSGIDIGTDGNVVMTGYQTNAFFDYRVIAVKRNPSSGGIINSNVFNIDMFAVHMIIDKADNNIYICGGDGGGGSSNKAMIVKITPSLTLGYQYTTSFDEFYQDITVKDTDNLMTATQPRNNQYTISLNYKFDGSMRVKWEIGQAHHTQDQQVTCTAGIATDLSGDVVACGGLGCIDTIKCAVTTQQDIIWQT